MSSTVKIHVYGIYDKENNELWSTHKQKIAWKKRAWAKVAFKLQMGVNIESQGRYKIVPLIPDIEEVNECR